MPYIKQYKRDNIIPTNSGELNFHITKLCNNYIEDNGKSYDVFNEIIGVLECAKLEVYRRVVAPYEDQKKEENGDVYTV